MKNDKGCFLKCYWDAFSDEMNAFRPYGKQTKPLPGYWTKIRVLNDQKLTFSEVTEDNLDYVL